MKSPVRSLIGNSLGPPTVGKVLSASAVVHVAALAAAWTWTISTPSWERTKFLGLVNAIELEITLAAADPVQPLLDGTPLDLPVVVTPRSAQVAERHFVQSSTRADQRPEAEFVKRSPVSLPPPELAERRQKHDTAAHATDAPHAPQTPTLPRRPTSQVAVNLTRPSVQEPAGNLAKKAPRFYDTRPPIYPNEARSRGWQGETLLKIRVSETGRVVRVEVARSSGYPILDAAAANAVRTWQGEPALLGDRPVSTTEWLPVRFQIPNR